MSIIKPEAEQGHAESVTCEQRVLAFEQWCRDTTPCWNCNHIFPAGQAKCDSCGATNANVDFHQARLNALVRLKSRKSTRQPIARFMARSVLMATVRAAKG